MPDDLPSTKPHSPISILPCILQMLPQHQPDKIRKTLKFSHFYIGTDFAASNAFTDDRSDQQHEKLHSGRSRFAFFYCINVKGITLRPVPR